MLLDLTSEPMFVSKIRSNPLPSDQSYYRFSFCSVVCSLLGGNRLVQWFWIVQGNSNHRHCQVLKFSVLQIQYAQLPLKSSPFGCWGSGRLRTLTLYHWLNLTAIPSSLGIPKHTWGGATLLFKPQNRTNKYITSHI